MVAGIFSGAKFDFVEKIGSGGFSQVDLVTCLSSRTHYAMKTVYTNDLEDDVVQRLHDEANLLKLITDTKFVVKLYESIKMEDKIVLLLEPCYRGDVGLLLERLGSFSESETKFIAGCVITGLLHLQSLDILYRDLKPENLLIDDSGYVKISDLGMSRVLSKGGKARTVVGTAEYLSPCMIKCQGYDHKSIIWSLGILVFELLTGYPPFTSHNRQELFTKILNGFKGFDFPDKVFVSVQEIILMCCRVKPNQRPNLEYLQRFMWFADFSWKELNEKSMESPLSKDGQITHEPTTLTKFQEF